MALGVSTFLMFDGKAEQAMNFYVSLFGNSSVEAVERYGPGEPVPEGGVKTARFNVGGHPMMCIDSPVTHAFTFTPSVSLFVECESAEEQDQAFARLADGGQILMPLDNYGFSTRFGWLNDRFGVSWQLNLA
ncbi:VOC family protein [soil metagenome]|nr:VOC family protein [Acidobacteriota bacterium]